MQQVWCGHLLCIKCPLGDSPFRGMFQILSHNASQRGQRAGREVIEWVVVKQNIGLVSTLGRKFYLQIVKNEQLISCVITWETVIHGEGTPLQMKTVGPGMAADGRLPTEQRVRTYCTSQRTGSLCISSFLIPSAFVHNHSASSLPLQRTTKSLLERNRLSPLQ